jgi:predicted glycosyltransferase
MNYLFYLGHPAHFHLFKNIIKKLKEKNNKITIIIKTKDILEKLLIGGNYDYINILPEGRKGTKAGIAFGLLKKEIKLLIHCLDVKYNLMIGTSPEITHIAKLLGVSSICVNEDDAAAVPLFANLCYPFASTILTPASCNNGKWERKSIKYNSYHELAYLNPESFIPDAAYLKYYGLTQPFFILRFSKLNAYHDSGISGISDNLARKIIKKLRCFGNVYITSEKELINDCRQYKLNINPSHIHDVIAFANLFIGDSQTMSAEAAVLGTPALRFGDFVGRLGYLEELELKYGLTYGIKTFEPQKLLTKIDELLCIENIRELWKTKRQKMLQDKINAVGFIVWLIENYPDSTSIIKNDPDYQYRFKVNINE